ncbi:hypothetical protein ACSW8L_15865 (plasmid) [Clostridium perfringens]
MRRTKTHEEFVKEVKKKYSDEITIIDRYINAKTKILIRHKCGYKYKVNPDSILRGHGCPKCAGVVKKTTENFKKEIEEKYGNEYEVLGEYINCKTKILVRHNCDGCHHHEWMIAPSDLLQNKGCPVCSNQKVVLGINTIWDTDRWMLDLGVSEEDAKKYSKGSNKKISVKCPDCEREKKMKICDIYYNKSIGCACGNGKSYPEKFVFNLLEQLDVDFETEYSPSYIKPKRYDFYLKNIDCIIETHGSQHYKENFKYSDSRSLQEEQVNDKLKREIALQNGIKHYIELDCSESNLEYIKNSILNSELAELFNLSIIDWTSCGEFANKNIVKEICDYWNNKREDETTSDVGDRFKIDISTINRYLKRGAKLGWCRYNGRKEMIKNAFKNGKNNGKKVEMFKNNKSLGIFLSCSELERQSEKLFGVKLLHSAVSRVCNNKVSQYKGYQFKYIENVA